jgi:hypothetical protein
MKRFVLLLVVGAFARPDDSDNSRPWRQERWARPLMDSSVIPAELPSSFLPRVFLSPLVVAKQKLLVAH